jgi:rfaE bifunctional protein kinase chain/domain
MAAIEASPNCTPNQEELERALGLEAAPGAQALAAAGRRLLMESAAQAVLLTRGAEGMTLYQRDRSPVKIPAYGSDEVADVTGAGDTVIAVFTLALLSGGEFLEAAQLANYAAGLVVMKAGTATVTVDEIAAAIAEDGT